MKKQDMNDFDKFKAEIERLEMSTELKAHVVHAANLYLQGRDGSSGTFYTPETKGKGIKKR